MPNDFKPETGHQFQFRARPIPAMGFDGNIYCEVLEIIPFQKLVYTWKGGPKPGVIELDTVLTWTLTPTQAGTDVILEHKGFAGFKNYLSSIFMGKGWSKTIPGRFEKLLNNHTHGISH